MANNATIYITDPSLIGPKLLDEFAQINKYESLENDERVTGMKLYLEKAQIQMNFMPDELIANHLNGFEGYIKHSCTEHNALIYLLHRLKYINFVIGCVTDPDIDDDIFNFLLHFNNQLNGLIFIENRLIDYDGEEF